MTQAKLIIFVLCFFGIYSSVVYSQSISTDTISVQLNSNNPVSTDTLIAKQNKTLNPYLQQYVDADLSKEDEPHKLDKKKMDLIDYIPQVHASFRTKYEYTPVWNKHRFQLRNARVSLVGNVHPIVAYKAEVDFCDVTVFKVTDLYINVMPVKGLSLILGQMKVPVSTDNLKSPHVQYFANRSFIVKQMSGIASVGFVASYSAKQWLPITAWLGVFNGGTPKQQTEWQNHLSYSARLLFETSKYFNFDINYQYTNPENLGMHLVDVNLRSDFYGAHIETEAMYKIYNDKSLRPTLGFLAQAYYDLKLPKVFEHLRFLLRYDMMSDDCNGYINDKGYYSIDDIARHRITAGLTLRLPKPVFAELRLNYEKYFYNDITKANPNEVDKLVVELVAHF